MNKYFLGMFIILISFSLSAHSLLVKKDFKNKVNIKNVNVFELFIVGNMQLVVDMDYDIDVKIDKKEDKTKKEDKANKKKLKIKKLKKVKKKKGKKLVNLDELLLVLPVPNTINSYKNKNNVLFTDLYNSSLPTKKKNVKKKKVLRKKRKHTKKDILVIQEVYQNKEFGIKSFKKLNEYLSKNKYNELDEKDYKYYIDRDWNFIAIKYVNKGKDKIFKTASLEPIHLSLEAANVVFPMRTLKENENFSFNFYILSNFKMDLKNISKFSLKTVETEDKELEQKNRLTILTELGDSVVDFYDAISSKNEIFKDMETNTLNLYHIYSDNIKKINFSKSDELLLDNK